MAQLAQRQHDLAQQRRVCFTVLNHYLLNTATNAMSGAARKVADSGYQDVHSDCQWLSASSPKCSADRGSQLGWSTQCSWSTRRSGPSSASNGNASHSERHGSGPGPDGRRPGSSVTNEWTPSGADASAASTA
jgi:hypothetical protein